MDVRGEGIHELQRVVEALVVPEVERASRDRAAVDLEVTVRDRHHVRLAGGRPHVLPRELQLRLHGDVAW